MTTKTAKAWARQAEAAVRRGNEPLWRYVFNLGAHRHYVSHPPQLGEAAREVEATLRRDGVARTTLTDLTGDPTLLERLQESAYDAERQRALVGRDDTRWAAARPFLVEMLDPTRPLVDPTGVLAEVATHPQLKGVVDRYVEITSRVSDLNIWRNAAAPSTTAAATQLWHRDLAEDRWLVKAFIYLEPVELGGGPFSYVRGSHRRVQDDPLRSSMEFDGVNYRVVDEAQAVLLEQDAEVCVGPAGSIVFADVGGLHRGGLARDTARFLMQVRYTSATASRVRMLAAPPGVDVSPYSRHLSYDHRLRPTPPPAPRVAIPSAGS